jgi:hypothetical protein
MFIRMKAMMEYARLGIVYFSFVAFLALEVTAIFAIYKYLGVI